MSQTSSQPNHILSYFRAEWRALLLVAISGLIYNIGLLANPWFEGQLAGCLIDILTGHSTFETMLHLVLFFLAVIIAVQAARYIKRFYVRRFANNVNRRMKRILYHNLLQKSKVELEQEGVGNVITKAISDVDDCVEGMRKFTTEIFDTGVALICYTVMLVWYDWRLALLSLIFPPISYYLAEKIKHLVQRTGTAYKEQAGRLSADTLDRVSNAITYRVHGCEADRNASYEACLQDYEHAAVKANIWVAALPPLYQVISMISVLSILYFGSKNVLGTGFSNWDIAAFTTFLSCFTKLSVKSSKAAKLFNSVHKAQVSWKRIQPYLLPTKKPQAAAPETCRPLTAENLSFAYPDCAPLFSGVSFRAKPGQIIGITGPVACGKTTLGKVFLGECPYQGSIRFGDEELSSLSDSRRCSMIGYLGHEPELFNTSIRDNILMGDAGDATKDLRMVCLDEEIANMPEGIHTLVGTGGVRLSGGQAKRVAFARTMRHEKPLLILDDPFSALDPETESAIFSHVKEQAKDSIILLISHRLYLFPQLDQIIYLDQGAAVVGTHDTLMKQVPKYAELYHTQKGEACREVPCASLQVTKA